MPNRKLKYHERLPAWPDFALPNNKEDGLLPSCRVNDWEHFMDCMRHPSHRGIEREMIYRGQRRYDWGLSSTLSREYEGGSIKSEDRKELLKQFKLAMRGRGPELKFLDENEIWAYGQHNGLLTPLLDWTKSPFVALYFSFVEPDYDSEEENTSRAIFCLNMSRLKEVMRDLFYEPVANENARLVNQAGLFTITPSGKDNFASYVIEKIRENNVIDLDEFEDKPTNEYEMEYPIDEIAAQISQYICKIHIPNMPSTREEYLVMLRQMNIHHGSLFPDPLGAAIYTKDWLHRKIVQDHEEERERNKEKEKKRERAKKKIAEESRFSSSGVTADLTELINITIRSVINEDIVSNEILLDWTPRIAKRYSELETVDWPIRLSARANILTNISRQLKLLGAGSSSQGLAEKLVEVLEVDYRLKHNLNFGDQGDKT